MFSPYLRNYTTHIIQFKFLVLYHFKLPTAKLYLCLSSYWYWQDTQTSHTYFNVAACAIHRA
jgi:hypothetical protein